MEVHTQFLAPELDYVGGGTGEDTALDLNAITDKNPGAADIWSIGKIALFLLRGLTDKDIDSFTELELDSGWIDFLQKSLQKNPDERQTAKSLLRSKLFTGKRTPNSKNSKTVALQASMTSERIKSYFETSVFEQVMIGFFTSNLLFQANRETLLSRFEEMCGDQNQSMEAGVGEWGLKYLSIKAIL